MALSLPARHMPRRYSLRRSLLGGEAEEVDEQNDAGRSDAGGDTTQQWKGGHAFCPVTIRVSPTRIRVGRYPRSPAPTSEVGDNVVSGEE